MSTQPNFKAYKQDLMQQLLITAASPLSWQKLPYPYVHYSLSNQGDVRNDQTQHILSAKNPTVDLRCYQPDGSIKYRQTSVITLMDLFLVPKELVGEQWRTIPGYQETYQVSNKGRVRNAKTGRIMRSADNGLGYQKCILVEPVTLKRVTHKVHRLVAAAFLANPENKRCVNHLDFDRSNNILSNLVFCTHKENSQHAVDAGRYKRKAS